MDVARISVASRGDSSNRNRCKKKVHFKSRNYQELLAEEEEKDQKNRVEAEAGHRLTPSDGSERTE